MAAALQLLSHNPYNRLISIIVSPILSTITPTSISNDYYIYFYSSYIYTCDQRTGDKSIAPYQWFESIVAAWRR
jgi:hypothetical protein